MINCKKIGLVLLTAFLFVSKVSAQTLKDAEAEFEKMSYLNAAEMFEHALKGKISDADKQTAKLKLAYAYRQIKDSQNAERVYKEIVDNPSFSGDSKAYLYYAQALATNGKYKESQDVYEKYAKLATTDKRSSSFQKLYKNVETLNKNQACYKVEYLNLNTDKADFSPTYYKNGFVFNSGRTESVGLKRVYSWDNSNFLDLYYLSDISKLTASQPSGVGGSTANKERKFKAPAVVGDDEYTPATPNDSKTIGSYGSTGMYKGYATYNEAPVTQSENFSKTLNTKYHEGPVTFSSDGRKIVFTRNNYNSGSFKTSADRVNKLKLYTAEDKKGDGQWSAVKEVPFNNNEYSTGHPTLTKDDKLMYFVSDMPGGFGGTDVYVVEYNNGNFGTPVNLGPQINTEGNEMFPFVDEKGNLYFASDGHAGLGGLDIFFVELQDGKTVKSKIKNLGAPINTSQDDFGLITDGERRQGYLSSNRKRGGADDDIYRFTRECDEKPECRELQVIVFDAESKLPLDNADVEVSTEGKTEMKKTDSNGTFKICLDEDKSYLLKASREGYLPNTVGYSAKDAKIEQSTLDIPLQPVKEVEGDSLSARISPSGNPNPALPCKVTTLRGRVTSNKDKQPIAGVLVTLRNECDGTIQQVVTGADGRYQFDICQGCDYNLEAAKENFGSKSNKIKKVGDNPPKYINSNLSMFEEGDVITIDNIYYDYGRYNIRPDAARELEKLVSLMKRYPKMRIDLRSHTDSRSSTEFNQKLSENRSKSVVSYLRKRGIASTRLESSGFGETQLLNECADGVECTEEQHQTNRRTEFKVIQMQ
ncbi:MULTISPECIES: carboxypeptidase regulatory-like domain-containing protein [Bacteroidota]|uniref:Carboxypeptidase regulatory-like domain-containing protein n=1 Tax=Flectobacillus rivi TaxID=2984209 RepID=A0ABT6YY45_9BACT|nr:MULTISPECIES: carboxypeptidase regulatory-like domain-containing protein [Bacteroidota]MDI9873700.1 carboxypeptidase regulatory-like domain-containing protein [Flectobacillus rivi]NBB27979.1 OmpA family protein [Cellulophaga sp. BC115SP]